MVVRSRRVVLPHGVHAATIHIDDGIIRRIGAFDEAADCDVEDFVVSPGVVDTHVHVNEPGRTDWEGFDTATRAAAAGGVTTIVDMPLNSVPATTSADALAAKRSAARGQCHVDVAFWGGIIPGNAADVDALADAGVRGFKCFLVPSGVDEFPAVSAGDLRGAMPIIARRGLPLLVHAEDPGIIADWGSRNADFDSDFNADFNPQCAPRQARSALSSSEGAIRSSTGSERAALVEGRNPQYLAYLATRPVEAEVEAIRAMSALAREFGTHVHIVHVSSAEGVDEIARAKGVGIPISAETCPHYLTFAAEEIPDGAADYKCAPPIRERRHRTALWKAVQDGVLDLVASDHSPSPPAMKFGDFQRAWGGIASLELSLLATWTGLCAAAPRPNDHPFDTAAAFVPWNHGAESRALRLMAKRLSEAPATLAGLAARKGRIAAGCDADFVVWDPAAEHLVDAERLEQRHKLTPYARRRMRGRVRTTIVRGIRVYDAQLTSAGTGHLL